MIGSGMKLKMLLIAAVLAAGCDRHKKVVVAPAPPTTAPTTSEAATTTASISLINVGGHSSVFPPARLRIERDSEHLVATLFSDDPREALKDNYAGNSFYLHMDLETNDPNALPRTEWHFKAPSSASREDSPYGIFLAGRNTQLQPYDVRARFRRDADGGVTVFLSGQFQVVDATSDNSPAKMVLVAAELTARVDKMPPAP